MAHSVVLRQFLQTSSGHVSGGRDRTGGGVLKIAARSVTRSACRRLRQTVREIDKHSDAGSISPRRPHRTPTSVQHRVRRSAASAHGTFLCLWVKVR